MISLLDYAHFLLPYLVAVLNIIEVVTRSGMRWLVMLLVTIAVPLLQLANAIPDAVPVTVSTVSRSTPTVVDVTVDAAGSFLYVSPESNAVYRLAANGSRRLLAGSGGATAYGSNDGVGAAAQFHYPYGIACDTVKNIAYITDYVNYRLRRLVLATNNVTTLAGSIRGHIDGIGTAAQFCNLYGIVYHSSGVLYVTDNYVDDWGIQNAYIRRITVASANVSTVTTIADTSNYLCINSIGELLYVTTASVIVRVDLLRGGISTLAGSDQNFADGNGPSAKFSNPRGIALNGNESALIIVDYANQRLRRLELATSDVTTIVGSSLPGSRDGPGANATFNFPWGAKWYCNTSSSVCGVLVAEYGNSAVRFVSIEAMSTPTAALSQEITNTPSLSRPESLSFSSTLLISTSASNSHLPSTGTSTRLSSQSNTNAFSTSSSASSSKSSTTGPTSTSSIAVTKSNATIALTLSSSASLAMTSSLTSSHTKATSASLTASTSRSKTSSRSVATLSPLPSMSRTCSNSRASNSPSHTRRTATASASTYCALVPDDGESSLGSLQPLTASSVPHGVIPLSIQTTSVLGTSPAPLSRSDLLRNVPLGANISLSLGGSIRGGPVDGWEPVSVTVNVLPAGSLFPLLTAAAPFTLLSTAIAGRKQSLVLQLGPGNASSTTMLRWFPTSLSTFRDVTLVILMSLRCPTDRSITSVVSVEVPCPGEVQPLTSEVKAAGSVAQYSTPFAGPAAGGAVGRLTSVRSLVLCSGDAIVEGLLPLVVDACSDDASVAADARGSILGNLIIWAAVCALMALAIVVYAHLGHTSLRLATEALGVPSQLLPLIVVTVPSTVSSTYYLLHSPGCGTDGVVAVVGVTMVASPLIMISLAAYSVPRCLTLVKQEQKRTPHSYAARLMSTLFHRRVRWRGVHVNAHTLQIATSVKTPTSPAAPPSGTVGAWLRAATVLLLDYAVVWYAFVDVAVLTASCVLGALGMLESASLCRGGAIAILVMYIMQFVVCVVVWPFTTLFSHAYALFTLAMSSIAVMCQVWYLYGSVADNADLDALRRLLTAAAVCDLLVSGVSMLKTLMDVVDGVKACRRHITALSMSSVLASAAAADRPLHELHLADDAVLHNRSRSLSTSTIIDEGFDELMMPTTSVEGGSAGGIVTAREIAVYEISDLLRIYGETA